MMAGVTTNIQPVEFNALLGCGEARRPRLKSGPSAQGCSPWGGFD